jgi:esterase/lipase
MEIVANKSFRVQELPVESEKVIFIFTAMGTKIGLYKLFVRMLNNKGYSVVIYDYPLEMIINARLDEWEQFYTDIVADAQVKLAEYKSRGASKFYSYGVSMGTLIANKFARDTTDISHVVLNMTYGDVADTIWGYRGVKKTKQNLVEQGFDLEALRANLRYADPIVNASQLQGKKVLLYLSRADKVLRYEQTQHTLNAFKAAGLQMEYVENNYLGHYATGAKNMMELNTLVTFLDS